MTYSDKLKDPRWLRFRDLVFDRKGCACETCGGEDKPATRFNHIHHKRYITGREPWEYDMDDVSVLCRECHDEIHTCEASWRNLIRSMPSWVAPELQYLVDTLSKISPGQVQQVAAWAKNESRRFEYGR